MAEEVFILIAEDDEDDRFILKTAFDENGFKDRLEFVRNGIELEHYLERELEKGIEAIYPRFILLDLNMPMKDGRETLEELKKHPVFKHIPVIVFSTTHNEQEMKKCYALGANSYISKPGDYATLLETIKVLRTYWIKIASIPR